MERAKCLSTYTATIYIGFKERDSGILHTLDEARAICQTYVDSVGLCVTIMSTEFIYTNGQEAGCIIGLINYPRFPSEPGDIRQQAISLGSKFLDEFNQYRISIVCSDETIMLTNEGLLKG